MQSYSKRFIKNTNYFTILIALLVVSIAAHAEFLSVEHVAYNAGKLNKLSKSGAYYLSKNSEQFGIYEKKDGQFSRIAGLCCFRDKNAIAEFVGVDFSNEKILAIEFHSNHILMLTLWDVLGEKLETLNLKVTDSSYQYSFEKSGRYLFLLDKNIVTIVDLETMKEINKFQVGKTDDFYSVWGDASLRYLALTQKNNNVVFYDIKNKKNIGKIKIDAGFELKPIVFYGEGQKKVLLPYNNQSIVQYDVENREIERVFFDMEGLNFKYFFIDENKQKLYRIARKGVSVFDLNVGNKIAFVSASNVLKEGAKKEESRVWFIYAQFNEKTGFLYLLDNFNSINQLTLQKEGVFPLNRKNSTASKVCSTKSETAIGLIRSINNEHLKPETNNRPFCDAFLRKAMNETDVVTVTPNVCNEFGDWLAFSQANTFKSCKDYMPYSVSIEEKSYWPTQKIKGYSIGASGSDYSLIYQERLYQPSGENSIWHLINNRHYYHFFDNVYSLIDNKSCKITSSIFVAPNKDYVTQRYNFSTSDVIRTGDEYFILDIRSLNDAEYISDAGWSNQPKMQISIFLIQTTSEEIIEPVCRWSN